LIFPVMNRRALREKPPQNPRRRAAVGLIPLTVIVGWLMFHGLTDRSGPFHGTILLALAIVALAGLALLWLGVLRLPKNTPQE
jgi:hypothetical protein